MRDTTVKLTLNTADCVCHGTREEHCYDNVFSVHILNDELVVTTVEPCGEDLYQLAPHIVALRHVVQMQVL